jgi:hypothetical protein
MAKIDEEQILLRFSLLVRDTESLSNVTLATEELRSSVEEYAQNLFTGETNVIVEANFVANIQV